ncbi:cyanobactin biosynthesis system PatB/AcyB/McaB family protein [Endothiovibrio diazotrophicus]
MAKPRSLMPIQSPPVRRPDPVHPHRCVDVEHGSPEALFAVRMALLHGANYNDPGAFDACAAARYGGGDGGGQRRNGR